MTTTLAVILLLLLQPAFSAGNGASLRGIKNARSTLGFSNSVGYFNPHERRARSRRLADFRWGLRPVDGYPKLDRFMKNGGDSFIDFRYNFTGVVSPAIGKTLEVTIWRKDCLTPPPINNTALAFNQTMTGHELDVQVEIVLDSIAKSPFYKETNISYAEIAFCLRVDYMNHKESINFHETKLYVAVDLTAGFELVGVSVNKTLGGNSSIEDNINCEIRDYFCDDKFNELPPPVLTQGDSITACIESTGYYNIRDIVEANLDQDKNRDGTVDVHDDIITNSLADALTQKQCLLGRCQVKTMLSSKYFTERNPANLTISGVVICGFGRSPTVNAGVPGSRKPVVAENSTFLAYPVLTTLNDPDHSDEWVKVVIEFKAQGSINGSTPQVLFGSHPPGVNFTTQGSKITLSGNSTGIEEAMGTLQIRPGKSNGEDITVNITGTARAVGTTITSTVNTSFVIPVDPVVQGSLNLTLPTNVTILEDTITAIQGVILGFSGDDDTDGSELTVLEIKASTIPSFVNFYVGSIQLRSITNGWLRVASSVISALKVEPPPNFSGAFTLTVREAVIDTTESDVVIAATGDANLTINVLPVADGIATPSMVNGIEDMGSVKFGATLASTMTMSDNGSIATGNNPETETISNIAIIVPTNAPNLTYTMSGLYVPASNGTYSGYGSARVSFNSVTRNYTISSTLLTTASNLAQLNQSVRELAEADIRQTFSTFEVLIGPNHTDVNGDLSVQVTAIDVMRGVLSSKTTTFKPIRIQAVADTPFLTVSSPLDPINEDTTAALYLFVNRSADDDNSETLTVKLTVPSDTYGAVGKISGTMTGITVTSQGSGAFLVSASGATGEIRQNFLNSFFQGVATFEPRNGFSGAYTANNTGIRVDAISTESATGSELAPNSYGGADGTTKTETVTAWIRFTVYPVADPAIVTVKGNAAGFEDTNIRVPLSVSLQDDDGSESYSMQITNNLPSGAKLFGANGVQLSSTNGIFNLKPADVDSLSLLPPLHWSSPLQGDIVLNILTVVNDTSIGRISLANVTLNIAVSVTGVADKPNSRSVTVEAVEDVAYDLGTALGSLSNILVDTDTSESLYLVLANLPKGVFPYSASGGINYLGSGKWQISQQAAQTLVLPANPNYSGEIPYQGITLWATSQEIDGSQAKSDLWNIKIKVQPVADGFSSWSPKVSLKEGDIEKLGTGIALGGAAATFSLKDTDGSESAVWFKFNLTRFISDSGVGGRLQNLAGAGAGLNELVANYINGTYTWNSTAQELTILAKDAGGVYIKPTLFLDSNQDFVIPVTALVRDTALIQGANVTSDKTESGNFTVDLVGTADTPTVFGNPATGAPFAIVPVSLGGTTTDTDVALGRPQSEQIYYVVNSVDSTLEYSFLTSTGNVVGLSNNGGYWLLTPSDLDDLNVFVRKYSNSTNAVVSFRTTTVALENDGDMAWKSANFNVTLTPLSGGTPSTEPYPLPPILQIGNNVGNEDEQQVLRVAATMDPNDVTSPKISIVISNLPQKAQVFGARLNPLTSKWIASAEDVAAGNVTVKPPPDFSGTMNITLEAVASTSRGLHATSIQQKFGMYVDPVADGASLSATPTTGREDEVIVLKINATEVDIDGSEDIGSNFYVTVYDGGSVENGTTVKVSDSDATIAGRSFVGTTRVSSSLLSGLRVRSAANWHGDLHLDISVVVTEPLDNNDGDNVKISTLSHTITVTAAADPPSITAPANVTGQEDTVISISGLSSTLVDTVTTNGPEILSVVMRGVPEGSQFSAGSNNGDGSWFIPVSALSSLTLRPPAEFSGNVTMYFSAIALELSNGDEANSTKAIQLTINPVADPFLVVAKNLVLNSTGLVNLDLSIRMQDVRGNTTGETPSEAITLTFTSVPITTFMVARLGGRLMNPSIGQFVFTGSEAQANALSLIRVTSTTTATFGTISVSGTTRDGNSVLSPAITDTFDVTVQNPTTAGLNLVATGATNGTNATNILTGGNGNDVLRGIAGSQTLTGGAGHDQLIGGPGADTMTGGAGRDVYTWSSTDLDAIDIITDFVLGEDTLNFTSLTPTFSYQFSDPTSFIQLSPQGTNNTIVKVKQNTAFVSVVQLLNQGNLTLAALLAAGGLLL